jgi:hypothetical protein
MTDSKRELLQGTLDLLILKTLATESLQVWSGWSVHATLRLSSPGSKENDYGDHGTEG